MPIDRRHLICHAKSKYLVVSFYSFRPFCTIAIYCVKNRTSLGNGRIYYLAELDRLRQDLTQLKMSVRLKEKKRERLKTSHRWYKRGGSRCYLICTKQ